MKKILLAFTILIINQSSAFGDIAGGTICYNCTQSQNVWTCPSCKNPSGSTFGPATWKKCNYTGSSWSGPKYSCETRLS